MADDDALHDLWLRTIRTEGARVADMPADVLDVGVPSLPGWTLERVVRHLGRVHRWVTGLLAAPLDADAAAIGAAAAALPRGPECLPAYAEALDAMATALQRADPGRAVASFRGPADVAFWCRRQAHELSVHRVDAADAVHAAGGPAPEPLDVRAASDGVDEWLRVFVTGRPGGDDEPVAWAGRTFGFSTTSPDRRTDGPARRWSLTYDAAGCASVTESVSDSHDDTPTTPLTAQLVGPSPGLLLTVWRRRPLDTLTVTGDAEAAAELLDALRF